MADNTEKEKRVEEQEDKIIKLQTNVFQVANYYFVFQGLILIAFASPSSFHCRHVWLPLILSIIGFILNFGTLSVISNKYNDCLDKLDERSRIWYEAAYSSSTQLDEISKIYRNKKRWRAFVMHSSMVLFFIFAVANLVGIIVILC